jgi:hypothetical protein
VPAEPSRHRVAVWRELRRAGAVALGPSVWALPDAPAAADRVERVAELVGRGGGELTVPEASGRDTVSQARLERLFVEARAAEWAEFRPPGRSGPQGVHGQAGGLHHPRVPGPQRRLTGPGR